MTKVKFLSTDDDNNDDDDNNNAGAMTIVFQTSVIWKRFLPNGPFSAFFNDFEIFNGSFLIILRRLLWAIFQVNVTMAHGK